MFSFMLQEMKMNKDMDRGTVMDMKSLECRISPNSIIRYSIFDITLDFILFSPISNVPISGWPESDMLTSARTSSTSRSHEIPVTWWIWNSLVKKTLKWQYDPLKMACPQTIWSSKIVGPVITWSCDNSIMWQSDPWSRDKTVLWQSAPLATRPPNTRDEKMCFNMQMCKKHCKLF